MINLSLSTNNYIKITNYIKYKEEKLKIYNDNKDGYNRKIICKNKNLIIYTSTKELINNLNLKNFINNHLFYL